MPRYNYVPSQLCRDAAHLFDPFGELTRTEAANGVITLSRGGCRITFGTATGIWANGSLHLGCTVESAPEIRPPDCCSFNWSGDEPLEEWVACVRGCIRHDKTNNVLLVGEH